GQLHHAGRRQDRDLRSDDSGAHRLHAGQDPARPLRRGRGGRGARSVLRLGGLLVHHRRGVRYFGRTGDLLSEPAQLTAPGRERRSRLTGIALMTGAVACFACLDASAKYLNGYIDTLEVVWARYTGAFLLALIVSNPLTRPGVMTTRRPLLQVGRSALLLGSTMLNFFALKFLQLDEALSILFSTPFLVAVLSGPILGERM